jgi:hypothetical protein
MKRFKLSLFVFLTVLIVSPTGFGQSSIREIDAYAKKLDSFSRLHKSAAITAADVSDYRTKLADDWRVFKTQAAFRTYTKKNEVYTMADNWKQNGRVVKSEFGYSSPSGDWSQAVGNYFRSDGSLAKASSEMRTFVNNCVIKKSFYYDASGKLISKTAKYFDVRTNRPKKPCEAMNSGDVTYYTSVSKLPFAKLLQ